MPRADRKSTRLNSSHVRISYAVFCLKKKKTTGRSLTTTKTNIPKNTLTCQSSKFVIDVQSQFLPLRFLNRARISFFFFFNDTATTEIYTLSLHDALPI